MRDEIVEEVQRVREEHAARFHYDISAILADVRRSEADREWPQASFLPRRVHPQSPATGAEGRKTPRS